LSDVIAKALIITYWIFFHLALPVSGIRGTPFCLVHIFINIAL